MINIINNILIKFNIPIEILKNYDEQHRFYHNLYHLIDMLTNAKKLGIELTDSLVLAIVFHDIIYDPKRKDNEERSADLFYTYVQNNEIYQAILDTKHFSFNFFFKIKSI